MTEQIDAVQQQELAFFDQLMPSGAEKQAESTNKEDGAPLKYPKPNEKGAGAGGRGKGQNKRWDNQAEDNKEGGSQRDWQNWRWKEQGDSGNLAKRVAALEQQVSQLARLSLRHEDGLNLVRAEVSYVIHAKIGCDSSIVGSLAKVQATWREMKLKEPQKLDKPMRATLVLCLFKEIICRVQRLPEDEKALKEFRSLGWISEDSNFWPFLVWKAETKQLVPQLDRPGLPTQILVEHLSAVVRHCTEEHALARFHPIRPISDSMAGESVVFLLQVGLCSESGSQLGQHLKTLCMNRSLQLCGCTLRPDRTQRSNLANQISKSLG